VAGYDHFCPVARASEIFAERWTPLVVRELLAGHERFNRIRCGLHRISPGCCGNGVPEVEPPSVPGPSLGGPGPRSGCEFPPRDG